MLTSISIRINAHVPFTNEAARILRLLNHWSRRRVCIKGPRGLLDDAYCFYVSPYWIAIVEISPEQHRTVHYGVWIDKRTEEMVEDKGPILIGAPSSCKVEEREDYQYYRAELACYEWTVSLRVTFFMVYDLKEPAPEDDIKVMLSLLPFSQRTLVRPM